MKGSGSLSDADLLSIIIGSGIPGENSLEIARNLLSRCRNSLCEFWKISVSDLHASKLILWDDRYYSFADEGTI